MDVEKKACHMLMRSCALQENFKKWFDNEFADRKEGEEGAKSKEEFLEEILEDIKRMLL